MRNVGAVSQRDKAWSSLPDSRWDTGRVDVLLSGQRVRQVPLRLVSRLGAWACDKVHGVLPEFYAQVAADVGASFRAGRALDVGAGPGELLAHLAKMLPDVELFGVDASAAMVRLARQRLGRTARIDCGSCMRLPYPNASFDLVVSTRSFYQWRSPIAGLDELHRVLTPTGIVFLYDACRDCNDHDIRAAVDQQFGASGFMRRYVMLHAHLRHVRMSYTRPEVEQLVRRSRFESVRHLESMRVAGVPGWFKAILRKSPSGALVPAGGISSR
jgi:ubiquinone/menaquinone biosynthesis C-methylase UbiE